MEEEEDVKPTCILPDQSEANGDIRLQQRLYVIVQASPSLMVPS